jgi:hypothetical protein
MDPRAGLDDVEKRKFLPPPALELRPLGRPFRSESLYRLSYAEKIKYKTNLLLGFLITETKIRAPELNLRRSTCICPSPKLSTTPSRGMGRVGRAPQIF